MRRSRRHIASGVLAIAIAIIVTAVVLAPAWMAQRAARSRLRAEGHGDASRKYRLALASLGRERALCAAELSRVERLRRSDGTTNTDEAGDLAAMAEAWRSRLRRAEADEDAARGIASYHDQMRDRCRIVASEPWRLAMPGPRRPEVPDADARRLEQLAEFLAEQRLRRIRAASTSRP